MSSTNSPPFPPQHALNQEVLRPSFAQFSPGPPHVPDQPTIPLDPTSVTEFLTRELATPLLDELAPRLWLFATRSGDHVYPLNRQSYEHRKIVVSEKPSLHMIWFHSELYLKPIPPCLLNHDFWQEFLGTSDTGNTPAVFDRKVVLGFLRSYAFLVKHRSDFTLALQHGLIPEGVSWPQWAAFIEHFRHLRDDEVAVRYEYGQIRLTRLNSAVRLFQPRKSRSRWHYHQRHAQTSTYLINLFGPLLFVFASLSLSLAAMQVILSSPQESLLSAVERARLIRAFRGFSYFVLISMAFIWVAFIWGPMLYYGYQLHVGWQHEQRKKLDAEDRQL